MAKKLLIIGGEGKGGSIAACVEDNRQTFGDLEYEVAGFINDFEVGKTILGFAVLGGAADVARLLNEGYFFVNAVHLIGNNYKSVAFFERLNLPEERLATIISRRAFVANSAQIDPGACVMPGACVSHMARLGAGAMVMANATVTHHAEIRPLAFLAIGSITGSYVQVGKGASVALGATVVEHCRIGDFAVAGAAALVIQDIPEGQVWAGSPARFLRVVEGGSPPAQ